MKIGRMICVALCMIAMPAAVVETVAGTVAGTVNYQIRLFGNNKQFSSVRQGEVRRVKDLPGFTPAQVALSPYGGLASRTLEATGYFRTQRLTAGGGWWIPKATPTT